MKTEQFQQDKALELLRKSLQAYYPLSDETFEDFKTIVRFIEVDKEQSVCAINEVPTYFYFVYEGLLRAFILDEKGNEYNKTFFDEGTFPGSMVALLKEETSEFEIQALEKSKLIAIDFKAYRQLLHQSEELKWFQIHYLEQNWLIKKEAKEVAFVQEDASSRYETFLQNYPSLESRLTQYHIASHLGVTPTQLSRIRKKRENQHM